MSERSFRRDRQRRIAAERRRESLRRRRHWIAAGIGVGAFALAAPAAQAASFEVNTLADAPPDGCTTAADGCTLRDAITDATANAENDTITFQSGLSGTITLTEGQLEVNDDHALAISGPGAPSLAVSGDSSSRVMEALATPGLTISGLTLTRGNSDQGGALEARHDADVSLDHVAVTENRAFVGGGISNQGKMTITNSTISGNTAEEPGGGIFEGNECNYPVACYPSSLSVANSTISGNEAGDVGGAVAIDRKYDNFNAQAPAEMSVQFNNSTIASNLADNGGALSLRVEQGANPTPGLTIPLVSTIVGDNLPHDLDRSLPSPGSGFDLLFSLVEDPGDGLHGSSSSIIGSDPLLGGLAYNGGPTQTQLPASNSPAVDKGTASGLASDQRGSPRTVDRSPSNAADGTDIGAVELGSEEGVVAAKCKGKPATIVGSDRPDKIKGTNRRDVIVALGGKDKVSGLAGNDLICGGTGKDTLKGGKGKDKLLGQKGNDTLKGGKGKDTLKGGKGKDTLKGGKGKDKLKGGPGKDKLIQ